MAERSFGMNQVNKNEIKFGCNLDEYVKLGLRGNGARYGLLKKVDVLNMEIILNPCLDDVSVDSSNPDWKLVEGDYPICLGDIVEAPKCSKERIERVIIPAFNRLNSAEVKNSIYVKPEEKNNQTQISIEFKEK